MAASAESHDFISEEAFHILICAAIGFILASALRVQYQCQQKVLSTGVTIAKASPESTKAIAAYTFPSALPAEIASSIAHFIDLSGIAQIGTTNILMRDEFWNRREVWCELSVARCPSTLPLDSAAAREHFRRVYFHISGDRPQVLLDKARNETNKATEVLEEATHMLQGMMPNDSESSVRWAIDAGGTALWVHAGADPQAARAAESFLRVAARRTDLVMPWQLEHLGDALRTTQELEASMDSAMRKMIDEVQEGCTLSYDDPVERLACADDDITS